MKIAIASIDTDVLQAKPLPAETVLIFCTQEESVPEADLYIDFGYEEKGYAFASITEKPVLVNAVVDTCAQLPSNAIRFNGWPGFIERGVWEICGAVTALTAAEKQLQVLGWEYKVVPDVPGMIAARVIAMIINEAYFGWGEGIAEKQAIDTALKLGTNYPYGPFEWAGKIGLTKIHSLLQTLQGEQARYTPAPALLQALQSD
jgi:3-hydroxybutyryl-CoA dehydrogenase